MEEKKKSIKGEICLLAIILLFVLVLIIISIGNSSIPELSKENVKTLIIKELEPQLDEIREKLSVSKISVEFNIDDYEYRKPTIFSEGYISFDVYHDAYVSDEFNVLENGIYSDEFCEKYEDIDAIEYPVELPKYRVHIHQHYDTTRFIDGNRNEYSFISGYRYKNGDAVNETTSRNESSSKTTCSRCDGTGRVTKSYGKSWSKIEGYGYGDVCGACGGTGRI